MLGDRRTLSSQSPSFSGRRGQRIEDPARGSEAVASSIPSRRRAPGERVVVAIGSLCLQGLGGAARSHQRFARTSHRRFRATRSCCGRGASSSRHWSICSAETRRPDGRRAEGSGPRPKRRRRRRTRRESGGSESGQRRMGTRDGRRAVRAPGRHTSHRSRPVARGGGARGLWPRSFSSADAPTRSRQAGLGLDTSVGGASSAWA